MITNYPDVYVKASKVHIVPRVTSINIANVGRTLADPPKGGGKDTRYVNNRIPSNSDYFIYKPDADTKLYIYPYARNLTGAVVLVPGFNCGITKDKYTNSIQLVSSPGTGKSLLETQTEFPLYEGEYIPTDSNSYAGGIPCYCTVKAINGVSNKIVALTAGPGISITRTAKNKLKIELDDKQMKGKCEDGCGNMN